MCKSSVLGFVLLFAFIFKLEKPSWRLVLIILTMTVGVLMMAAGETEFSALGFVLVMTAAACSGFRWSLTHILLIRHPATANPFSSIFALAPVMFASLMLLSLPVEGPLELLRGIGTFMSIRGPVFGPLILLFPGFLAFCMTASEFALLQRTSVLTLSIAGIFKEVVTLSTASVVFDETLTLVNLAGVVITIIAIVAYNWMKYAKIQEEARAKSLAAGVGSLDRDDEFDASGGGAGDRQRLLSGIGGSHGSDSAGLAGLGRSGSSSSTSGNGNGSAGIGMGKGPAKRPEDYE